ncbi:MAG: zinc-dependent alcohol dehydrogenase family protein [Nitrospirota bacterium]|nr:zinc-dependent alcohol dehydrogenase family protein [Nitrospirota bacterium]MDE3243224.1 zinc-dependent alcohol dehydrogenase family protein [Nitrospirota bacterium]
MRAMVMHEGGDVAGNRLTLQERPIPEPGAGVVRLKVLVCGVCRTDLHIVEEELPPAKRPIVPGHEVVGIVDRVGAGVRAIKEGDRVGIAWLQQTCGRCEFCASGRENLCLGARFTGYHEDGGYADYALVPEAFAYPLPPVLTDEEAAPLLCAGIIGYRALRLSGVRPGQRLGLYGFGASAHLTIQVAKHWGCSVYVCSLREEHRKLARDLGAAWVGGAADAPPDKLHGAIIFAPAGEIVPAALRALDRGGTVAIAGIHMTDIPPINYDRDLFGERTIRSVTANTKQDGLDFLREAAAVPIRPHTRRFRLEEANHALQQLKAGTFQGAAVLTME